MKSIKKAFLFGFLIWLIVFVVAIIIFPIHEGNRPFFESIMPVAMSVFTSFFAYRYFRIVENNYVKEGIYLGLIFIVINWVIDAVLMLSPSPMQMTFSDYVYDIGFTYFMIPPITFGFGYAMQYQSQN